MSKPAAALDIGKRVGSEISEKNVTFMAAGIAYNAFVSLAPLLVLLLLFISIVGSGLEDRLLNIAQHGLPGPIADVVEQVFSNETAASSASVIGVLVLLWGTLKIFRGLDTAFSTIYETERDNSFVDQIVDGIVVAVALIVSIAATVATSAAFAAFANTVPVVSVLTPIVLVGGLVVAFFPMYYRFPDVAIGWRDALPGALIAAIGWAMLQGIFQIYLLFRSDGSESFFGGVLVVVTWLYFSGLVLLIGAVLNAVIGGHATGGRAAFGRAAGRDGDGIESRTTMNRDELSTYLRDLRGRITGHYEELQPTAEAIETIRRPADGKKVTERVGTLRMVRPLSATTDDVEVIERIPRNGDGRDRTVTIRWRSDDGSDERG